MSKDPILRAKWIGNRRVEAYGGLHYIRGNSAPYFSLTMGSWLAGREDCFGAVHEELCQIWPELQPLADLHLSDSDGVPMHAAGNGYYFLAGSIPLVARDGYTAATSKGRYNGEYREPTPDEALEVFARYVRIPIEEAKLVRQKAIEVFSSVSHYQRVYEGKGVPAIREMLAAWVEEQKPRWMAEADKCIQDLDLVVYGDPWRPLKAAA